MDKTTKDDLYAGVLNDSPAFRDNIDQIAMRTMRDSAASLEQARKLSKANQDLSRMLSDQESELDRDIAESLSRSGVKPQTSMSEDLLGVQREAVHPDDGPEDKKEDKDGPTPEERARILDEAMKDLDSLIGLKNVKDQVKEIKAAIVAQQARKKFKLLDDKDAESDDIAAHLVLLGRPGTGKTTVARIYARILKGMGILKKGDLIETDRSGLVAGYVGQTAKLTNKVVDSALDSVLFIDEVYNLNNGDNDTFGQEAIATLMKRMEDDRDRLVVIVAGYTDETERFLDSNPGLRSRFVEKLEFEDYTDKELVEISEKKAKSKGIVFTEENRKDFSKAFSRLRKTDAFANGRTARSLLDNAERKQSLRFEKLLTKNPDMGEDEQRKILTGLTHEDIKEATEATVNISTSKSRKPKTDEELLNEVFNNNASFRGRHSKPEPKTVKTHRGNPGEAKRVAKATA